MTLPTVDETEAVWIARTHNWGYHYIQEIFPDEEIDRFHRANCRLLLKMGRLLPEYEDYVLPSQRKWNPRERYYRPDK